MSKRVPANVFQALDVTLSKYDLEGSEEYVIGNIRKVFRDARSSLGDAFDPSTWMLTVDWKPRNYELGDDLTVYVTRPETPEETAQLDAEFDKRQETTRARELKMLADLAAKYPDR